MDVESNASLEGEFHACKTDPTTTARKLKTFTGNIATQSSQPPLLRFLSTDLVEFPERLVRKTAIEKERRPTEACLQPRKNAGSPRNEET
jgi:hypothetical protein